jgi:hypothetical protein
VKITMRVGITGTRNGEDWPPVGGTIDLPTDEANALVDAGLADAATKNAPAVEAATVAAPEAATTTKPRGRKAAAPKD